MCRDANDVLNPALTVVPAVFGIWQCKISGLAGFPLKLMILGLDDHRKINSEGRSQGQSACTGTKNTGVVFLDKRPQMGTERRNLKPERPSRAGKRKQQLFI
jgi:hypothetical protein